MSVVVKIVVGEDNQYIEVSNVREDGAFVSDGSVSVNDVIVNRVELQQALSALATATEGDQNW